MEYTAEIIEALWLIDNNNPIKKCSLLEVQKIEITNNNHINKDNCFQQRKALIETCLLHFLNKQSFVLNFNIHDLHF